jgi:hypothetical protein
VPKSSRPSREGELFTADRAGFLRELRLGCAEAAALFTESEGMFFVASEIAPVLPCPIRETLLSIPSLMSRCRMQTRGRRARAYFRYLKVVRDGIVEQTHQAAQFKARSGQWSAWAGIQIWLRGRISWQLAMLEIYGLAYRSGVHLNFERRTAALSRLIALLDR